MEQELEVELNQIFSAGDFGLFLSREDWQWLTGPKKYRNVESTPQIIQAWTQWRYRFAAVAGNHEPLAKLRDFHEEQFDRMRSRDISDRAHPHSTPIDFQHLPPYGNHVPLTPLSSPGWPGVRQRRERPPIQARSPRREADCSGPPAALSQRLLAYRKTQSLWKERPQTCRVRKRLDNAGDRRVKIRRISERAGPSSRFISAS